MLAFDVIIENIDLYISGFFVTAQLVGISLMLGLMIAVPIALLKSSSNPLIWLPIWIYIYFFRGTPLLIQLFMIYYGAGQFEFVRESIACG